MEASESEIATIIAEVAEVSPRSIKRETRLAELGIDSLDALRIVAAIEKMLRTEIPEESIGKVETVDDILKMVAALR